MEEKITAAIVQSYFEKLQRYLAVDLAVVGAGPSGLVAAARLARTGKKVAIFERRLAPGGGIWGGGMLFNEIVFQEEVRPILEEFDITYSGAGSGYVTADAVEAAAALILAAKKAGVMIFNAVSVEDVVCREGEICGVVVNWTSVNRLGMPVDPLVIMSRAVLDGTGHPGEIATLAAKKAGVALDTPTGGIMGERPMWMELGEASTVENTKRLYPGLYVSGMAANNASGGFRMGPIFGGMFLSGRKVADLIGADLDGK